MTTIRACPLKDLFIYPIKRYIPPVAKVDDTTEEIEVPNLELRRPRTERRSGSLPDIGRDFGEAQPVGG